MEKKRKVENPDMERPFSLLALPTDTCEICLDYVPLEDLDSMQLLSHSYKHRILQHLKGLTEKVVTSIDHPSLLVLRHCEQLKSLIFCGSLSLGRTSLARFQLFLLAVLRRNRLSLEELQFQNAGQDPLRHPWNPLLLMLLSECPRLRKLHLLPHALAFSSKLMSKSILRILRSRHLTLESLELEWSFDDEHKPVLNIEYPSLTHLHLKPWFPIQVDYFPRLQKLDCTVADLFMVETWTNMLNTLQCLQQLHVLLMSDTTLLYNPEVVYEWNIPQLTDLFIRMPTKSDTLGIRLKAPLLKSLIMTHHLSLKESFPSVQTLCFESLHCPFDSATLVRHFPNLHSFICTKIALDIPTLLKAWPSLIRLEVLPKAIFQQFELLPRNIELLELLDNPSLYFPLIPQTNDHEDKEEIHFKKLVHFATAHPCPLNRMYCPQLVSISLEGHHIEVEDLWETLSPVRYPVLRTLTLLRASGCHLRESKLQLTSLQELEVEFASLPENYLFPDNYINFFHCLPSIPNCTEIIVDRVSIFTLIEISAACPVKLQKLQIQGWNVPFYSKDLLAQMSFLFLACPNLKFLSLPNSSRPVREAIMQLATTHQRKVTFAM